MMQYYFTSLLQFGDWGFLVLRLAVGVIFIYHGVKKIGMWRAAPSPQMPASMLWIMRALSVVEPLGGAALIVGFMSQASAAALGVIMIGATWFKIAKWKTPFFAQDKTGWEFDFVLFAACVAILLLGSGGISIDYLILWM